MSALRSFSAPTRIVAGLGALERLARGVQALAAGRVAVVCDEGVANAGLLDEACSRPWRRRGQPVIVLPLVRPDPARRGRRGRGRRSRARKAATPSSASAEAARSRSRRPSRCCCATSRRSRPTPAGTRRRPRPRRRSRCPRPPGPGSEVSNALVLHDPEQESIVVIRGQGYEPRVAILDGRAAAHAARGAAGRSRARRPQPRGRGALGAWGEHVHGRARGRRGRPSARRAAAGAAGAQRRRPADAARGERDGEPRLRQLRARARARALLGDAPACAARPGQRRAPALGGGLQPRGPAAAGAGRGRPHRCRSTSRSASSPRSAPESSTARPSRASIRVALASPLHLNNSRHATAEELEELLASASA